MKFDSKDLDLVRRIAEDGSLTAAARRMHVSQPAVSKRLSNLQERVGSRVFVRKDGRMRATAVGERLLAAAGAVDREISAAREDIGRILEHGGRHLRLTTQCYTCYRWLPFVIRDMRNRHPDLELDVIPDATDNPYAALEENRCDVAIVSNPIADSGLQEIELFSDELYAVMSVEHELANRTFLNPPNLAAQTFVLYTGTSHPIVDEILHPAGITPARIIQVRITEAIVELARAGQGIAVLAGWAFNDLEDTRGLVAVRITRGGFRRTWRAVIGRSCPEKFALSLVECLRATGSVLGANGWRDRIRHGPSGKSGSDP
jgi:LysR family transcriptional regulator for metE and metH